METPASALEPSAAEADAAGAHLPVAGAVYAFVQRHAVAIIVLVAGFVRFWRLSVPHEIMPLDETYYARDAADYLRHGAESGFAVHPPVGKWMIAVGIKIFGNRPFGWRFTAALVGTLSLLVVYFIAKRLWNSRFAAITATSLLAVDGLFFVQSRIAMLDIFLAFFILAGFWLLLEDRARAGPEHTGRRWWRLGSGLAFGLALATKWAAGPVLVVAFVLAIVWEAKRLFARSRPEPSAVEPRVCPACSTEAPHELRFCTKCGAELPSLAPSAALASEPVPPRYPDLPARALKQALALGITFGLLPVLVYVASYTPWFLSTKRYVPPRCNEPATIAGVVRTRPMAGMKLWLCDQREILDYHKNLKSRKDDGSPVHPYMSRGLSWPWIGRPAAHYFKPSHVGTETYGSAIFGIPNPLMWWPAFLLAIPMLIWWAGLNWLVWLAAHRLLPLWPRPRGDPAAVVIIAMFAPLYLPWLVTSRPLFMFYMTPAVPFLALALTHVFHRTTTRWPGATPVVATYVALTVVTFAYFYPVLAAFPIPESGHFGWRARMWFQKDCLSKGIKLLCWI